MAGATKVAGALAWVFLAAITAPSTLADQTADGPTPSNAAAPTFSKDVLPILQRSCQKCHQPGTSAPMSLMTYEEARPWARSIKQRVTPREMPPWHIDRSIGEYAQRSVAERRRNRHDRARGLTAARRRATRPMLRRR